MLLNRVLPAALAISLPWSVATGATLLCIEEKAIGFQYDNAKGVEQKNWSAQRLLVNLDANAATIKTFGSTSSGFLMACSKPALFAQPDLLACTDGSYTFVIHEVALRFTYAKQYGYVTDARTSPRQPSTDGLSISYGVCERIVV